jgi:hypothetical protein
VNAVIRRATHKEYIMRPTKLALSALAIAFALGGTAYAADTATPAKPAASSTVQTAQAKPAAPAKHRIFHRRAAKKAPAKASTSTSTQNTSSGAH